MIWLQIHNGKAIVYYNTFIDWLTEWQTTYASGKHTTDGHKLSQDELASSMADVIITDNISDKKYYPKSMHFSAFPRIPVSMKRNQAGEFLRTSFSTNIPAKHR